MGEMTTPRSQTKKKLIIVVGLVAAIVAVSLLICALHWPDWLGSTEIRATTNYVIQMDELAKPAGYDPNDDAREDYEEARHLAVGIPAELDEARSRYPTQWSPEVRQGIVRWIAANEQALGYLDQGAKKAYYWPVYAGSSASVAMPELAGLRDLIFALDTRIKVRASAGDHEQVLADVVTLYRLGQHLGGPKAVIHQLVGMATRSMVLGTVRSMAANQSLSPQTLDALQRQLQELGAADKGVIDFRMERLVWLDYIQRMFTDEGDGQGHIPRGAFDGLKHLPASDRSLLEPLPLDQMKAMLKLNRQETTACVERFFGHIQVAASMTPWEFEKGPNRGKDTLEALMLENAFVDFLGRPDIKVIGLSWRARTEFDASVTLLAVLRYAADRGAPPESLGEMVLAGYLDRIPQDPYSNGPLVYKCMETGFLLYSCGEDLDDDGGTPSKWGQDPNGGDQVFWPVQEAVSP